MREEKKIAREKKACLFLVNLGWMAVIRRYHFPYIYTENLLLFLLLLRRSSLSYFYSAVGIGQINKKKTVVVVTDL